VNRVVAGAVRLRDADRCVPHGACHQFGTVIATLLSIVLMGEVLTPVQFVGAAIMLAALCTYQLRRG
jgi:drug/metabolite transporter (DMT)-like permease